MYLILGLTAPRICVYLQRLHDNAYPNRQTTLRVKIDQLTGVLLSYWLSHVRCQTEKAALFWLLIDLYLHRNKSVTNVWLYGF